MLSTRRMSKVKARSISWLWPNWIPLGKLCMVDGDPDLGKSTVLLDLAARVSNGDHMPDGSNGASGEVVLMSAEDDDNDTVKPRLLAAGGNLERITSIVEIREGSSSRLPEIPKDLPPIYRLLKKRQAKLLIVDPLMSYLVGTDSCKEQDVRRTMFLLKTIARKANCSILCMRHFTKMPGGKPIHKASGSIGIIAAARAGLMVAEDPEDASKRIVAPTKGNLSVKPEAMRYSLQMTEHGACRVNWEGSCKFTAKDLVDAGEEPEELGAREEAKEMLVELLHDGPAGAKAIQGHAKDWGISPATLNRAKADLKIKSFQEHKHSPWYWKLPDGFKLPGHLVSTP